MIELFDCDQWKQDRHSSKGNQLKWRKGDLWYKADYTGYEGLAEYMVSHLLLHSSLNEKEFVLYDPETIHYRGQCFNGVVSHDFLEAGWQMITLERLFMNMNGQSLFKTIWAMNNARERMFSLVTAVEGITGLRSFGTYLTKVITIDALFLNEDRHTHNLGVLMDSQGHFALCPIFDQGAGLMADTTIDYPLGRDPLSMIPEVESKTFSSSFDEQLDLCEEFYGTPLQFTFSANDVEQLLTNVEGYSDEIKIRVWDLILARRRKYQYLFKV